ncbi:MAG: paraquat-inducible protein A [Verrucomicrobiae bacterium]|nr:paraquat-inducible protein A [Verrucomicrobiae bacterium]
MRFSCPTCNADLHISEAQAGRGKARCPDCDTIVELGNASSNPAVTISTKSRSGSAESLKSIFPGAVGEMSLLLYGSVLAYLLGIVWPLMTIEKKIFGFPFSGDTVSLLSGIAALFSKGDVFLFLILFTFSIAFPVGKFIVLFRLWYHPYAKDRCSQLAHRLAVFGKWSMLDVIVVGLLVVIVKIRGLVSVHVHAGVYFFAASVILTMLTSAWIGKMLEKRGA